MNLPSVTLLIYTITINLRYSNTRAILPRDYHSSFQPSSAVYEKEDTMNEYFNLPKPGSTVSVRLQVSKDLGALDSISSMENFENDERFTGKTIVLSPMDFSIRLRDENVDNNTILLPIVLALDRRDSDETDNPTISNSEIKRSGFPGGPEDPSRNDSGLLSSHLAGNNYFLITLLSQNISDAETHGHTTNWTVLIIARHITSPETFNLTWVVIAIIVLIVLLLAGICPIILAYGDFLGGGREDEEKMMVDLITPFRHQDYPTEIQKVDTGFRSLGPDRSSTADISKHLQLKHGNIVGNLKTNGELDQDGDAISLDDFKICQARKMINLQPFRPPGHDYNEKISPDDIGSLVSPTASTSTSSFTANNPISPLSTITSPTSFQSLAFSDYHSPLPSLPKKCITT
ncbi:hypothetical protein PTTG_12304 [Puccinia triticina 1-1 BBBD Race 1]|uniref:Uncharacterized protein n=2 Tax=Puccinia triticina TaxID=208348 RepID=A0A180H005_PUCT1|nr:uncharacterized protein PtA15_9A459 [Puccinia triticina]OAV98427.1 hypothetical protein PTTG_12304 [Puccinia triticina 1-1 BBBD Race 1]WAQ88332.1 hypothetical protein PtA15_9A459 [Puccinia triticina]WAR60512.1 hypothetical protein PtB15_9B451 [Puccinia triticina]